MDELDRVRETTARLEELAAEQHRLTERRDAEIVAALAAGATWTRAMDAAGLSRRGIKLAVDRAREHDA